MQSKFQTEFQRLANLREGSRACLKALFPGYCLLIAVLSLGVTLSAQSSIGDIHVLPQTRIAPADKQNVLGVTRTGAPFMKSNVDLVLVPVTVTDSMNRPVTGLEKKDFEVYEGKYPEEIRQFSNQDAPVSIGIILDVSGSMSSKIERAREAVLEFCKTANPQDEFFLITFANKPELQMGFTQAVEDIENGLIFTQAKGRTALLDAIYLGVATMREAKYPKKALLVISDGGDNNSRYTEGEVKENVIEADTMIYSIGIYDSFPSSAEEQLGPQLLNDVAKATGGRAFTIDNPNDLLEVAARIGIEMRTQYVLGYRPQNLSHDGKWHKIKVKLHPPKGLPRLQVYSRSGYYASSQ